MARICPDPGSKSPLDKLATVAGRCPGLAMRVGGHTDTVGGAASSRDRARLVAEYLISKGVDPQHLSAIGYGEGHPVVAGGPTDNQANRRIEIRVAPMSLGSGATVASARQTGGVGLR